MAPKTFGDLPPELVGNVFDFIRSKADQSAICLVSRACRDLAGPMLWEILDTDLRDASSQSLVTLLRPESGITRHIRSLNVHRSARSWLGQKRLRLLLKAIPRDRLWEFSGYDGMERSTVQLLLRTQHKIRNLSTFSLDNKPGPQHHAWMRSTLADLVSVTLATTTRKVYKERILRFMESVSDLCPRIEELELTSWICDWDEETSLCAILGHPKERTLFANLTKLRLYDQKLATAGDETIGNILDLSKLRSLTIDDCDDLIPFIQGLSLYYTNSSGDLEELRIGLLVRLEEPGRRLEDPRRSVVAIEELLEVCPKLRVLRLALASDALVAKDYIAAHGRTLHSLTIGIGRSKLCCHYSPAEISTLLHACIELKWLALDMPVVRIEPVPEPGPSLILDGEFADVLSAVSVHPTLEALRILNLPEIDFDRDDDEDRVPANRHVSLCQALMQNFANHAVRFMANHESTLRILSIMPMYADDRRWRKKWCEEMDRDVNGHAWPAYHYVRGCVLEPTGTKLVVAHPSTSVTLDFPDLADFLSYIKEGFELLKT